MGNEPADPYRLCSMLGVQTSYTDVNGQVQSASPEALMAVVRSLGVALKSPVDAGAAIGELESQRAATVLDPVSVGWEGQGVGVALRWPANTDSGAIACRLQLESGETYRWEERMESLPMTGKEKLAGHIGVIRRIEFNPPPPTGYHRFSIEVHGREHSTLLIVAPVQTYRPDDGRHWGLFAPLYSIRSKGSWGAGDYSDLARAVEFSASMGGRFFSTLPLMAGFLEEPFNPSPYAPASRLFWSEFFIDPSAAPEWQSADLQAAEIARARQSELVDYREVMRLKRHALEAMSRRFFASETARRAEFEHWRAANPEVDGYARWRALHDRLRQPWMFWPEPMRSGEIRETDIRHSDWQYHRYAQWLASTQLDKAARRARELGEGLYLDFPIGSHPDSYEVWRHRDLFANGMAVGAPPDPLFTKGQNWGFPPLLPDASRATGHAFFRSALRQQMRMAGVLRLDHVMSLHRLYCVPDGMEATEGVYIRYQSDELHAILCLESQRHRTRIIGEDLGTVPDEVREAMRRHGMHRLYVMPFNLHEAPGAALASPPEDAVACLNTHDMPPFAAFVHGLDLRERVGLGHQTPEEADGEWEGRERALANLDAQVRHEGYLDGEGDHALLGACLARLADSPARLLLVNAEDLMLETRSQNVPGTGEAQRPNWRGRMRLGWEEFASNEKVQDLIQAVRQRRLE